MPDPPQRDASAAQPEETGELLRAALGPDMGLLEAAEAGVGTLADDAPLAAAVNTLEDNTPLGDAVSEELFEQDEALVTPVPEEVEWAPEAPPGMEDVEEASADPAPPSILERNDLLQHLTTDAPVEADEEAEEVSLDQESVDELMAALDQAYSDLPAPGQEAAPSVTSAESEPAAAPADIDQPLSQEFLDSIIAAASTEEAVVSENLAAAAMTPGPDFEALTQNDLDHIIERAKELGLEIKDLSPAAAAAAVAEGEKRRARRPFRPPGILKYLREHKGRLAASLLVGLLTTGVTYTYLTLANRPATPAVDAPVEAADLADAMAQAQEFIRRGDYARAIAVLEPALAEEPSSPLRLDASYLLTEAQVKGFVFETGSPAYMALHEQLDGLIKEDVQHARAPEALLWKAELYELDDLHVAAFETYNQLIEHYPNFTQRDVALRNAARLSVESNRAAPAAQYAQQLLNEYPGSPLAGETRLLLARAYEMAGLISDARTLYVRLAEEAGNSPLGNQALLRLGHLYHDRDEHAQTIQVLEELLATTTTTEGSDEAYLLLAQAYRATERYQDALNTLNDLLNFLPESDVTPTAFVELSQVTDLMGQRDEALRIAEQASVRFPEDPQVLKNKGMLLGLTGSPFGAGATLVAAEEAGAHEPGLLLAAGRHFTTAGEPVLAREAYDRLEQYYPGTPEAYAGGIEDAQILYRLAQPTEAVDKLESMVIRTANSPYQVDVMLALADMYHDLGLNDRVAELGRQVALATKEPEELARAAQTMLSAGQMNEAMALLNQVDLASLNDALEYRVQMDTGAALMAVDPRRGLERMEQAYYNLAPHRTLEDEQRLLQAYLRTDRTAAARRLISDLQARVKQQPIDAPLLIDATIDWGDHLYAKGDYRAALGAYDIALETAKQVPEPVPGGQRDVRWALFQRANALLELSDYAGSISLFDEIAASDAPWAEDAQAKAAYARIEQRRRGFAVSELEPLEG